MIKLAVSGCLGRMGESIARLALKDKDLILTTLLERKDHPKVHEPLHDLTVRTDNTSLNGCDALIEFTSPDATIDNLSVCIRYGVKMVIGTTGFTPKQIQQIEDAAKKIPIVYASNMSVGVNILFKLTEVATKKTGEAYTIHMTEAHHVHKKDAPSGTAKTLQKLLRNFLKQK